TNLGKGPKEFPCPVCGSDMVIKLGRGGRFLSCERFPECDGARMIDGSLIKGDEPIGTDPKTGKHVYVLTGRFGPYVQLGELPEKAKKKKSGKKTESKDMPRRAGIPKGKRPDEVTLEDALKYLLLPRKLGMHPETGE